MENRNTRTLTANRNGLNLGLSTKFDVALAIDAMVQVPQMPRHAHPQQSHQRCVRMRPVSISARSIGYWSLRGAWPTASSLTLGQTSRTAFGEFETDGLVNRSNTASKRNPAFAKCDARPDADARSQHSPGRSIDRREPLWTRS